MFSDQAQPETLADEVALKFLMATKLRANIKDRVIKIVIFVLFILVEKAEELVLNKNQ